MTERALKSATRPRSWRRVAAVLVAPALAVWTLSAAVFVVDVTEDALVTRFGAVVRVVREPGLHLKAPFDTVVRLDRRLTFSRPGQAEYLTVDKKNIVVESLVIWRVADPERYFVSLPTRAAADVRLADVLLGEVGATLGRYTASALIAPDGNAQRFRAIVAEIREHVASFAQQAYGIEVADVDLLRLSLPEQNRASVFERMKAERGKMAKEHRTAGEVQARKIIAQADREKVHIEAQAYEQAQRIRAEGDAEVTRIYAAAFGKNPAFYKFLRTLQAYEKFLDDSTTLFLPADAEMLRVLGPLPRQAAGPSEQRVDTAHARGDAAHAAALKGPEARPSAPAPLADRSAVQPGRPR